MSKPTPATITWNTETNDALIVLAQIRQDNDDELTDEQIDAHRVVVNTLRFHTVIFEDHEASSEITKFPVQTGFEVSDHTIKKNRKIKIEAMITNTLLENSSMAVYSSNNQKTVFETIKSLIGSGQTCKVVTNLGIYENVVFNSFKTKQMQGMVDSMKVILSGEELQVKGNLNKSAPAQLSFTLIPKDKLADVQEELVKSGVLSKETDFTQVRISSARANLGTDFSTTSRTSSGEIHTVTYICSGWDGDNSYTYEVNSDNTSKYNPEFAGPPAPVDNIISIPTLVDKTGGLDGVTNCLLEGAVSIINEEIDKKVDTVLGLLDKTIYGFKQDIIRMGGNDAMQSLIGMSLDCLALGVSDVIGNGESTTVDGLVGEGLQGIKGIGNTVTGVISSTVEGFKIVPVTLFKIETLTKLPLSIKGFLNF